MEQLLPLAEKIAELLKARGDTVAVAESSSGGLVSAALLAVPGASAYFVGGGVLYTRKALLGMTQITEEVLRGITPGTEEAALARARIMRERLATTWGVSETGTAGPTGSRYGYPPGHTAIGVSGPVDAARIVRTDSADRLENMYAFARRALELFAETLQKH